MTQQTIQQTQPEPPSRRARFKRYLSQSNWITDAWSWFMVLAGKAAEPVLILSVLYSSAKLLPAIQPFLTPQFDAAVFIAQFIALDVGGLSLNKMADQVQETNPTGARNAKRLSYALVSIMIAGVILASLSGLMSKIPQVAGVIDTILLIARAVLAVLYSRVIHSLKKESDGFPPQPQNAPHPQPDIQEQIDQALTEQSARFDRTLAEQSQRFDQAFSVQSAKHQQEIARLTEHFTEQIARVTERLNEQAHTLEERHTDEQPEAVHSPRLMALPSMKPLEKRSGENLQASIYRLLDQDQGRGPRELARIAECSPATAKTYRDQYLAQLNRRTERNGTDD